MVLVSEESQLAAVVTKLRDGGSNAYSLAGLKGLASLPSYYTEVHVSKITTERTRGDTPDVRLWRVTTRAVALNYVNAQREREKAASALEGQFLTVDGSTTTRIQYDQSDDPIGPDEDRYSGISMYRYAH